MPKFPTIPRLSIVVPHCGDTQAFEASLVSVLQHRPDNCEVIVPHDGGYDDPFDLGDEVRFLDAGSSEPLRQITESASFAHGRFVHILADGHVATPEWTEVALAQFELHDAGVVVPVVGDARKQWIEHAGWRRSASAACDLIGAGEKTVDSREAAGVEGCFLPASFWRRDLLRSLSDSYRGLDIVEASMIYGLLVKQAGWRCVVAKNCHITSNDNDASDYGYRVQSNHRRLQAIADQFGRGGWGKSLPRLVSSFMAGGVGLTSLNSAIQRALAPLASDSVDRCVSTSSVLRVNDSPETLKMPSTRSFPLRRAA